MTNVYTDGSSSPDGRGGWAWTDGSNHGAGAEVDTTNQQMELLAVIKAIEAHEHPIVIHSDSAYVINCFWDGWHEKWRRRGWINSVGKPVANRALWEQLIALVAARETTFVKVKAHSGVPLNELADRLAAAAKEGMFDRM